MGTVPATTRPRWHGLDLDNLTVADLDAAATPVIALDGAGRIVGMSGAAARWAGVSAWQTRGRELARELAWRFGATAASVIDGFVRSGQAAGALHVDAVGGRGAAEIELLRGGDRIYLAIA
ncbi:MAG: hypothetical protein R3B06_05015 [Kofleriaceae bacterium]